MKKLLSLLLCALLLCSVLLPVSAEAPLSGTCGDGLTWVFEPETGTLRVSGSGAMENYESRYLPNSHPAPWAEHMDKIVRVVLPEGLTSVGDYSFHSCENLTELTLPEGLVTIGESAFSGSKLTSLTVPASVTTIASRAFEGCTALADVSLPDTLHALGYMAFQGCPCVEGSEQDGVYVDRYLIRGGRSGDGVFRIREGTVGIAPYAFENSDLSALYVPASMRYVNEKAFYDACVERIYFADGIEEIGAGAFSGAMSIGHIELPASVKKICRAAFAVDPRTSIRELCFFGAAPEVEEGAFLSGDHPSVSGVFFLAGQAGWTPLSWNGVYTRWWNGKQVVSTDFEDSFGAEWYRAGINYVVGCDLMNGIGGNKFDPDGAMTRAMLVTVLWRYAGSPAEGTNGFSDVPSGQWYTQAIAWAAAKGVVNGTSDTTFDPNGSVTREQMAAILYRYAGASGVDTGKRADLAAFPDAAAVSTWASDALSWTVAEGVIGGSDGKLLPTDSATRAQVATILMRYIENVIR